MAFIEGTSRKDNLVGTNQVDQIWGLGGADKIDGRGGDDAVNGGTGNDTIDGGSGNDNLQGAKNPFNFDRDLLRGGLGNDILSASVNTIVDGGAGTDFLVLDYSGLDHGLRVDFAPLLNGGTLSVEGGRFSAIEGVTFLAATEYDDVIYIGDNGPGISSVVLALGGNDKVGGGLQSDQIEGGAGDDILYGGDGDLDILWGNAGRDFLLGGAGPDWLYGGTGADFLVGGAGSDVLYSNDDENGDEGKARDTLLGGDGDDLLGAGVGDMVDGGSGTDVLAFLDLRAATTGLSLDMGLVYAGGKIVVAGGELSRLEGLKTLYGTSFDDTLALGNSVGFDDTVVNAGDGNDTVTGGHHIDFLNGQGGDDILVGLENSDYLDGGEGNDLLRGGDGTDVLTGGAGDDVLEGGADYDIIIGSAGADTIIGGAGTDLLTGGEGADRFVFRDGDFGGLDDDTADFISDFNTFYDGVLDGDLIDLAAVDAIVGGADDSFTFIGTAEFSRNAGELRYVLDGEFTRIFGDTTGDGVADFALILLNPNVPEAGSFIL